MDRARPGAQRGLDERLDLQVALRRGRRPDQVRLVGVRDVQRAAVRLRIDGDRAEPELAQRARDADRDLASIRDENLVERVFRHSAPYSPHSMSPADQLTVARALSVPIVILLYALDFHGHAYWATAVFVVAMTTDFFDGKLARRHGRSSPLGSLLDPIADKVLVLGTLTMLVGLGVVPAWMVATIVVREVLITGLRQAAIERGIVIAARDLGKLKTWAQAIAAGVGGFAAAGALERPDRVVGAARRGRADVRLGPRLRAQRAGALPAPRS